ncbi:hypothetical protein Tco_1109997 [Tanacetum coccineum]|uniref:Uncharacterized protein n=1 Tax=Tanacetum coccineum TaxID=301880 RepID=A0ABQ5IHT1_9ASTR
MEKAYALIFNENGTYYIQCIKDGSFKPKMAEDDIMESVISYETVKDTWTDLVHSFEGPFDTKENRIMDLKLEYQTFRAKSFETLSQTYTCYKTLLNELANDGVTLSKHDINVGFVFNLPEKWLSFSLRLRNANHTQTLDLANIYKRMMIQSNECGMKLMMIWDMIHLMLHLLNDLLTKDIEGFKTYDEYKDDWIYESNKDIPWVDEKPWTDVGVWTEPKPVKHTCKPFNFKNGCLKWPTCSWREDGYCNGGNLPGAYHIGNSLHYQDLEWCEALKDSKLKDEALRNKAIIEGLINDDESYNDCGRRWKSHEINYHDYNEREYENETHEEGHEICGIETRKVSVCQIKRYKMIKYSFNDEEEYVVVKEDEYDDLTITSEKACRAYQEIFRMMDEGWLVTRNE